MVPTLQRTLGVKGHRLCVGTRDNKNLLYVFGALNVVTGQLHTRTLESRTSDRRRTGQSKTARLQQAFAQQIGDLARAYPAQQFPRVVLIIDNAPWHRGAQLNAVLAQHRHIELKRLPSYSPSLNVIERLWKKLRQGVTHNVLFETLSHLKAALRREIGRLQSWSQHMTRMIGDCYSKKWANRRQGRWYCTLHPDPFRTISPGV